VLCGVWCGVCVFVVLFAVCLLDIWSIYCIIYSVCVEVDMRLLDPETYTRKRTFPHSRRQLFPLCTASAVTDLGACVTWWQTSSAIL